MVTSPFNLEASFERAQKRFGQPNVSKRKNRSDRGKFRISAEVTEFLRQSLHDIEFPGVKHVLVELSEECQRKGLRCPSRATVYKFIEHDAGLPYDVTLLPAAVQAALYNLAGSGSVPGAQLAFYCLNYGDLVAIQYAAGMPWWPLYQAVRMRGWRPRSHGVLLAILRARGISRA